MALAVGIIAVVVLGGILVVGTLRRRDTTAAIGALSRETLRRDRSLDLPPEAVPPPPPRTTGREVEEAAERHWRGATTLVAAPPAEPVLMPPPDPEVIAVTRRQFLNRGIISMFVLGLSGFGATVLAFLWPSSTGGFGGKIDLPDGLSDILAKIDQNKEPYYYAPGRLYVAPYPKSALPKAEQVYEGGVLEGMKQGIVALYQKCPHLGCRVPWCKTSQWFECPCHGSQYNRVGEKKGGPAPRGMDRFPVKVDGQKVSVDTGIVVQGPPIGTNTTGQEAEGPHCVSGGE
jgi:cytochrome b6-f complex iron-sulfur subunit